MIRQEDSNSFLYTPVSRKRQLSSSSVRETPEKTKPTTISRSFIAKLASRHKELSVKTRKDFSSDSPVKRKSIAVRASGVSLEAVSPLETPRSNRGNKLNFSLAHAKSILARTESLKTERSPSRSDKLERQLRETEARRKQLGRMYEELKIKNQRLETGLNYALYQHVNEEQTESLKVEDLREAALVLADEVAMLKAKFRRL
mmetsp:Transcript_34758/g.61175  ORF Transcript_34758/g.61175 Transcript_34758/m.61175 type:complete len:202 (+) Transcript_34758:184-789(+)